MLSFEWFKWGGVRHDDVVYQAFDLERFSRAPRRRPNSAGLALGQQLIDAIRRLLPGTTAARTQPHLKMIKDNREQRDILLEILGLCGILQAAVHPGYADEFIPYERRTWPALAYPFRGYPIWWCKAQDGVNYHALRLFFSSPQLA